MCCWGRGGGRGRGGGNLQLLPLHMDGEVMARRFCRITKLAHQAGHLLCSSPGTGPHIVQQPPQVLPGAALLTVLDLTLMVAGQKLCSLTQQVPVPENVFDVDHA
jgi:hypothetical protein